MIWSGHGTWPHILIGPIFSKLTIITYIILWLKVRLEKSSDVSGADRTVREKDKRLAITLVIPKVIFVFTGLPYPIMLSNVNLCRPCLFKEFQLLSYLSSVSKFLHLSNSFLNFVVYILRIAEFRAAITRLVCQRNFSTRVDVASSHHRTSRIKSSENTLVGQVNHNWNQVMDRRKDKHKQFISRAAFFVRDKTSGKENSSISSHKDCPSSTTRLSYNKHVQFHASERDVHLNFVFFLGSTWNVPLIFTMKYCFV